MCLPGDRLQEMPCCRYSSLKLTTASAWSKTVPIPVLFTVWEGRAAPPSAVAPLAPAQKGRLLPACHIGSKRRLLLKLTAICSMERIKEKKVQVKSPTLVSEGKRATLQT